MPPDFGAPAFDRTDKRLTFDSRWLGGILQLRPRWRFRQDGLSRRPNALCGFDLLDWHIRNGLRVRCINDVVPLFRVILAILGFSHCRATLLQILFASQLIVGYA